MIYNILNCTNLRQKKYAEIDLALKSYGVKKPDRTVTLDGHDFASQNIKPIDFITFDDECFNGAKNVKILEFNSIKGKNDFN